MDKNEFQLGVPGAPMYATAQMLSDDIVGNAENVVQCYCTVCGTETIIDVGSICNCVNCGSLVRADETLWRIDRAIDGMQKVIWRTARGSVLLEAHKTINGERQNVYGGPEDSFALIAAYWDVHLRSKLAAWSRRDNADSVVCSDDVAMMMTLFKIAREANQHKRDNICDAAGYMGIYADIQEDVK